MLANDIAQALPELRREAEAMMTDTCNIHRATQTWSEAQQKTNTVWTAIHLNVPCAVVTPAVTALALLTGQSSTAETPQVKIPVRYTGIRADDRVTIAGIGTAWVTHVPTRSDAQQVQKRLECRWTR